MGLAKSYISKLERRILDLENSNRILRQDTKISENNNSSGMLMDEPAGGKTRNETFSNCKEMEALRNQMKDIELEQLKTRLTVIEHCYVPAFPYIPELSPTWFFYVLFDATCCIYYSDCCTPTSLPKHGTKYRLSTGVR